MVPNTQYVCIIYKAFEYTSDLAEKVGASLLILHIFEELGNVGY